MPITTIGIDIQFQAGLLLTDEFGDVVHRVDVPGYLRALTPLQVMEVYEQLHARRNTVRKQVGLPEIPTPDEGVLMLAFLRRLREEPAGSFRELLGRWDEVARQVQVNRLDEATAPNEFTLPTHLPSLTADQLQVWRGQDQCPSEKQPWQCPRCQVSNEALRWKGGKDSVAEAACNDCGHVFTYQEWLHAQPHANGRAEAATESEAVP